MKPSPLLLLFFFIFSTLQAQFTWLSDEAEISILTVGPGDNLYDAFGHSAIRVYDPVKGVDLAYNYGVYDFDTPNFYGKFAQGKLNYKLEAWPFDGFLNLYKRQQRWVKEQVLNLNKAEKQSLATLLQQNALPENKYYRYDFLFDNCATKIRDILVKVLDTKLKYNDSFDEANYTFRDLIQKHVHYNSWSSFGMDVAIGAVVDQPAISWEYQFLPEYVFKSAEGATIESGENSVPLVKQTQVLFESPDREIKGSLFGPLLFFGILALIILYITYNDWKHKKRCRRLDAIIFFVTGLIGVILALLWFATVHSTTVYNYNLLWAFPFSILFFIHVSKREPKKWIRRYIIFLLLCLLLMTFHWISGVQRFPISALPLFIALAIRYMYLNSYLKQA